MKVQGDILFVPVNGVPAGLPRLTPIAGRYVFAEGEVTGHTHSARGGAGITAYRDGMTTFATVDELVGEGVAVEHQEHEAIVLEPGAWEIKRQVEWTDANEPVYVGD
jgi:predicted Zn-dependent protease